jgi:hypothetical protein
MAGDAIWYSAKVTPFIHGDMWSMASTNPYVSVNSGATNVFKAGRIH